MIRPPMEQPYEGAAIIEMLCRTWPLSMFEGGPDSWWLTGGAALAVHFGGWWRPLGDIDVTINRTDIVTAAVGLPSLAEEPLAHNFRAWLAAGHTDSPGNRPFAVDVFDLPISLRCVRLPPGLWYSTGRPELVLRADEAILRSETGMPYLAPDLVLLGKSRQRRRKDRLDFERAVPRLEPWRRTRLLGLLPPRHPWRGDSVSQTDEQPSNAFK